MIPKTNIFLIMLAGFSSCLSHQFNDFDSARIYMMQQLTQHNPSAINEFNHLSSQYDQSVIMFFDRKNSDSMQKHINRMQQELDILQTTYADKRFACIASLLKEYHGHISTMIEVLQRYCGSINSVALALKVRNFKFLLPKTVQKRGDVSLFWSIHHRLLC